MVQGIDLENHKVKICEDCEDCTKLHECYPGEFGFDLKHLLRERKQTLDYDYLVIALGGSSNYFGVPGAKEHAFPFNDGREAIRIRDRINNAFEIAYHVEDKAQRGRILSFVIVGAGPTGIELSTDLHDMLYRTLVEEFPEIKPEEISLYLLEAGADILPFSGKKVRKRAKEKLLPKRIHVLTNSAVTKVGYRHVEINNKDRIGTFTTIWTAGVKGNNMLGNTTLPLDNIGRVVVNEYLQAKGYPEVYTLGDCACFKMSGMKRPLPQTAQVAVRQAKCVVENIVNDIEKGKPCTFRYTDLGAAFSVGGRSAIANMRDIFRISGGIGWLIWKLIYLKHLLNIRRNPRSALEWFFDVAYDREASRHKFAK